MKAYDSRKYEIQQYNVAEWENINVPKCKPGTPGIFDNKTRNYVYNIGINYVLHDLFGKKNDDDGLICCGSSLHNKKSDKDLLEFLLPEPLSKKIEQDSRLTNIDYSRLFQPTTCENQLTDCLLDIFITPESGSEKEFIKSIQNNFKDKLHNAKFCQPALNDYLSYLVDNILAPSGTSQGANDAFHSLIKSEENIPIVVANVFISLMLGLYSQSGKKCDSLKNEKVHRRVYLLNKLGMEFIWTPEIISSSYIKLQDVLLCYKRRLYDDACENGVKWLAECGKFAQKSELATVEFILGSCLCQYPERCTLGKIAKEIRPKLSKYLSSVLFSSDTEKEQLQSEGLAMLEKSVSVDASQAEAAYILYTYYSEKNEQKAVEYLSTAYNQTYVKAVIEVANRSIKSQQQLQGITNDDIIEKLTAIISEQSCSETELSECLYLRGMLRLRFDANAPDAKADFEKAVQKGHEKARQQLARKKRMEGQTFPTFSTNPDTPCCYANSLDGNNLVFMSTLPSGKWRLFTSGQNNLSLYGVEGVENFKEFLDKQNLDCGPNNRKIILLFMSEDENRNLNESLMALDMLFNLALDIPEFQREELIDSVEIFVESRYELSASLIDASINDMGDIYFKVHLMDQNRDSAHQLLCDAPLFLPLISKKQQEDSVNVVLFGASETNFQILKESIGCAYLGERYPVNITMVGDCADHIEKKLRQECPGIYHEPCIKCIRPKFISCCIAEEDFPSVIYGKAHDTQPNDALVKTLGAGNYFVVDLEDDYDSIRFAMELRTWILRSRGTFDRAPFIAVKVSNAQNSYLASHLTLSGQAAGDTYYSRHDLHPFGIARDLYSFDRLIEHPRLEEVALRIHKSYYGGNDLQAENDYYTFSYNADSSKLSAMGLCYRLGAGGFYLHKEDYLNYGLFDEENSAAKDLINSYMNSINKKDESAAALEQSRWDGYMLSRGWEQATINEVDAYKEQSTGSSHKHTLAQKHPFIREWYDLESKDVSEILGKLRSKYDYNKHPKSTTKKNIKDTSKFFGLETRENERDR